MNRTTHCAKAGRRPTNSSKAALGRYLAAGLGATGLASVECEAAVVGIDITNVGSNNQNISGMNAGIASGLNAFKLIDNFPSIGSAFLLENVKYNGGYPPFFVRFQRQGFSVPGSATARFEVAAGSSNTSPFRFTVAGNSSVGPSLPDGISWTPNNRRTTFSYYYRYLSTIPLTKAPDWGAGSYLGFRARPTNTSTDWTYGYFEVTWNRTSEQFQIFSGAYESTVNTPVTVPEPSTAALMGIAALALGTGAFRRSREARQAAADGAVAAAV